MIPEIILKEKERQATQINLIPSENLCSPHVVDVLSSCLHHKYAEGYPSKRYYQGNEFVDEVEKYAIKMACELFGAQHANVQPLSGSPANIAVYHALLKPGDKILAMELSHGGHLTHGCPVNFTGKQYNFIPYPVSKGGFLDYEKIRRLAIEHKPKMIICGFTAYPRRVPFKWFADLACEIGAVSMADISHIAGLVAAGVHQSPFPHIDIVTSTTHKTLKGPRGAVIMCKQKFAKAIDRSVFPGLQGGPHMNSIAAKAVAFEYARTEEFRRYAKDVVDNAKTLASHLIKNGIALVSKGTDTHLILIDLINTPFIAKPGAGRYYAQKLEDAGIITNANTIPYDPSTPFKPSGIRIGTPFVTSQGMKPKNMKFVSECIYNVFKDPENANAIKNIREEIKCYMKGL